MRDTDLQKIERKTLLYFFDDGLWDMFLGIFIQWWGVAMLTGMSLLLGAGFVSIFFCIWAVKRRITYPRTGYVKVGVAEDSVGMRFIVAGIIAAVLVFTAVMVLLGDSRPPWLAGYFPMLIGGVTAFNVCVIAYWVRVKRFYLHAALIFIGAVFIQWLGIGWEWGFIGAGSIIVLIGLGILIIFLRRYPKATPEEVDAGK